MSITYNDRLFSHYIRTRDNWTCQHCHKRFGSADPLLNCSHFFSRGKMSTRFDPLNADSLCQLTCHQYFETHRNDYRLWKIKRIGKDQFEQLELKSNKIGKLNNHQVLSDIRWLFSALNEGAALE